MAERRLESVGNPAGRRVSRVGPWMARHGGPRIQAGVRACRAQARHRVEGQEPFGYFWALSKVTRCKSGTNRSRYRSNGYVHRQTATAGKPAPTVDLRRVQKTLPELPLNNPPKRHR